MTDELTFSHANIAMCVKLDDGKHIVWDRDADVFGTGWDFPDALADLAENYPEENRADSKDGD